MPIEGRGRHLDPKQIPTRDRDIHLVKIKFCSDINPQQTVEKAHNQHQPLIQRIWTKSLQGISWNSKVTLQCYTSWSWGHNIQSVRYTIIPLLNLGVPTHKVHQLATKLHCHTIKSLNKIIKTKHKIHLNNNSDNGGPDGGVTDKAAGFRRARRRPDRMADNPPSPHQAQLFLFFNFWRGSGECEH